MRCLILIAVLMLSQMGMVASDNPSKLHKVGGYIDMGPYHPPAPTNWFSIPEPARSRIISHLTKRLGDAFYAKFAIHRGQIVDFKTLREKEPNSKDYKWEVPAYRILLRFSLPQIGIEYYDACIECRSDGAVIHEIDLPE